MFAAIDTQVDVFNKGVISSVQGGYEDPTYLGFRLMFDFSPAHVNDDTLLTDNPLFADPNSDIDSAQRYLRANGYPKRAAMLAEFKTNLEYINSKSPWYFQSIEGLADIWRIETEGDFNNFRGKGKVITFQCLESIDLRMTGLADLYRKAVFDPKYMRELLPENLRWFTLEIQVAEMRSFHQIKKSLNAPTPGQNANLQNIQNATLQTRSQLTGGTMTGSTPQLNLEPLTNFISVIGFKFEKCEFDFNDSFPSQDSVSHAEMNLSSVKFKIKTRKILEKNYYKILDLVLADGFDMYSDVSGKGQLANGSPSSTNRVPMPDFDGVYKRNPSNILQNAFSNFKDDINKTVTNAGANAIAAGANAVNSRVTGAILGNVYEARNQSAAGIINNLFGTHGQQQLLVGGDVYPNVPGTDTTTNTTGNKGEDVYK